MRNYVFQNRFLSKLLIIVLVFSMISSCKKFIEVPPPNDRITEESVFTNDQTAISAITGLFARVSYSGGTPPELNLLNMSKLPGLSADEFDLWSGASDMEKAYYQNNLQTRFQATNSSVDAGGEFWNWIYPIIYSTNQAVENLQNSNQLTDKVRQQLVGECKFWRAFLYFYLVNLYGDVPVVVGTDPEVNRKITRSSVGKVYEQIVADLTEAKSLLNANYVNNLLQPDLTAVAERTRPNKWVATALLARVYLYILNYPKAAETATEIINQNGLYDLAGVPLGSVFKKNSKEAIWQLQPVTSNWNTPEARIFHLNASPAGFGGGKTVFISQSLLQDFEIGDARRTTWVNSYSSSNPVGVFYFPAKYIDASSNANINSSTGSTNMTEYSMVLRLAEQYLIRAEARVQNGDLQGAISDINIVRTRARAQATSQVPNPLPNLPTTLNKQQILLAIWHERRIELFSEWGHRWVDLKRTNQLDAVMQLTSSVKGANWQSYQQLYPIPARELNYASQLTQNPGYQ